VLRIAPGNRVADVISIGDEGSDPTTRDRARGEDLGNLGIELSR
jgi:hypothetical protein